MKNLLTLLTLLFLLSCNKNANRIEEMTANNGKNYVKKHFKNNSKIKVEVYDKNTNLLLTETNFKNKVITKLIEYYSNGKPKTVAILLKAPNFFDAKCYLSNGNKESEGSFIYNYDEQRLIPTSDWIFYNPQTQEADSIGRYFTDGKISVLEKVDMFDSKSKKKLLKNILKLSQKTLLKIQLFGKSNEFVSFVKGLSYLNSSVLLL